MRAAGAVAAMVHNANRTDSDPRLTQEDFVPKSLAEIRAAMDAPTEEPELDIDTLATFFGARQNIET
jgi:hypothetical protein